MLTLTQSITPEIQQADPSDHAFDYIVNQRQSICLFGQPGTGKTTLVKRIYDALKDQGVYTICTAFPGKAAMLLPGKPMTSSKLANIRLGHLSYYPDTDHTYRNKVFDNGLYIEDSKGYSRQASSTAVEDACQAFTKPYLVIIFDEISMASAQHLHLFYEVVRMKRERAGLSIKDVTWLLVGDFGQLLPPDNNTQLMFERPKFAVQTNQREQTSFEKPSFFELVNCKVVTLTKIWRQADPSYLQAINWAYWGKAVHPSFIQRIGIEPPEHAVKVMFNNQEVLKENKRYVENFITRNPGCKIQEFRATHNCTRHELKELEPIGESFTLAVAFNSDGSLKESMPFMCAVNLLDENGDMIIANGETVEVINILGPKSIKVRKHNNQELTLGFNPHPVSPRRDGFEPQFYQLPGYPGCTSSLYKCQGQTFGPGEARIYGTWEYGPRREPAPIRRHGALIVMVSRNQNLEDVYFDTQSLSGKAQCIDFLKSSVYVNEKCIRFMLDGKRPTWISDEGKDVYLIELKKVKAITGGYDFFFDYFDLEEDCEKSAYKVRIKEGDVICTAKNKVPLQLSNGKAKLFKKLAKIWIEDYLPQNIYTIEI